MDTLLKTTPSEEWMMKRKTMLRVYFVEAFYLGVEYAVFFLTLWVYIKDMLKVSEAKLMYSLTTSAYLISAICFAVVIGRIVDKYRCIRVAFLMSNGFLVVGNIIYALPFTPALPVLGRLIAGFGAPLKSIIFSEIARTYPSNELSSKFAVIGLAFGVGFVGGPAINIAFTSTDFYIGEWHITEANVTGVYMAVFFMILQILSFFFVYDLSKEIDLKQIFENSNAEDSLLHNEDEKLEKGNYLGDTNSMLAYFKNVDLSFILALSFFFLYAVTGYDVMIPMIVKDVLKWNLFKLNLIVLGLALTVILMFIGVSLKQLPGAIFDLLIPAGFVVISLSQVIITLIIVYHNHTNLVIGLWAAWVLILPVVTIAEEIYLPTAFAKMVPSKHQTTAESVRQGFGRFGTLVALMTAPFLVEWFMIFSVVMIGLCLIGICLFLKRWKYF